MSEYFKRYKYSLVLLMICRFLLINFHRKKTLNKDRIQLKSIYKFKWQSLLFKSTCHVKFLTNSSHSVIPKEIWNSEPKYFLGGLLSFDLKLKCPKSMSLSNCQNRESKSCNDFSQCSKYFSVSSNRKVMTIDRLIWFKSVLKQILLWGVLRQFIFIFRKIRKNQIIIFTFSVSY